jgi:hypothetical protein
MKCPPNGGVKINPTPHKQASKAALDKINSEITQACVDVLSYVSSYI